MSTWFVRDPIAHVEVTTAAGAASKEGIDTPLGLVAGRELLNQ